MWKIPRSLARCTNNDVEREREREIERERVYEFWVGERRFRRSQFSSRGSVNPYEIPPRGFVHALSLIAGDDGTLKPRESHDCAAN